MPDSNYTVTSTTDNFSQFVNNTNTISKNLGATGNLTTTIDSDIVGAINELDAEIGSATLTTTAQTLTGAIQEIFQGGFEELDLTLDSVKSSTCHLYTSPSPRDLKLSRMPSSA